MVIIGNIVIFSAVSSVWALPWHVATDRLRRWRKKNGVSCCFRCYCKNITWFNTS